MNDEALANVGGDHRADRVRTRGVRAGFTLPELIVAVAAVALLTVGIGQIFSSVGRLVGTGAALAETDQFARALEAQMRADFEALNRLRADEVFVAIRNRRLGDINGDGSLDPAIGEKPIYLRTDDRDADRRAGIQPYAPGSKAVTVRADELMFIASADDESGTVQRFPPNADAPGEANHVRIYYGHGRRPPLDNRLDPGSPRPTGAGGWMGNVPPRNWFSDGDFGDSPGVPNIYCPSGARATYQQVQGRNEFAGDWLLLRQPLLLVGGLAAGYSSAATGTNRAYWTYSPYIRGVEATERGFVGWGDSRPLNNLDNATPTPTFGGPFARLLQHGRTDVCAQGLDEVRRWLEGLEPAPNPPPQPPAPPWSLVDAEDATAFAGGPLDDPTTDAGWEPGAPFNHRFPNAQERVDAPLWQRQDTFPEGPGADFEQGSDGDRFANHMGLMSAIAGCFTRFLAEDAPPLLDRRATVTGDAQPFLIQSQNPEPTFNAFMDLHAVVGSRVSNFEVAWSDGETWLYGDLDFNGDGDFDDADDYKRGDEIWHDMDFARFNDPRTMRDLPGVDRSDYFDTMADNLPSERYKWNEVYPGQRRTMLRTTPAQDGFYDPVSTGAAPNADGEGEYLVIWPFREIKYPQGTGYDDSSPAEKPERIRIRMTVHDAQFRIVGGRRYEFEFTVDLK